MGSPALPARPLPAQKALHIRACAWVAKPRCCLQHCGNSHLCCPHHPVPAWDASSCHRCLPGIDRARDRQFFQSKHKITGRQSLPPPQSRVATHQTKGNLAKIKRSGLQVGISGCNRENTIPSLSFLPCPRVGFSSSSPRSPPQASMRIPGGHALGCWWDQQEAAGPAQRAHQLGRSQQPSSVGVLGGTFSAPQPQLAGSHRKKLSPSPFIFLVSCVLNVTLNGPLKQHKLPQTFLFS